jgi:hypothetical protein
MGNIIDPCIFPGYYFSPGMFILHLFLLKAPNKSHSKAWLWQGPKYRADAISKGQMKSTRRSVVLSDSDRDPHTVTHFDLSSCDIVFLLFPCTNTTLEGSIVQASLSLRSSSNGLLLSASPQPLLYYLLSDLGEKSPRFFEA